MKLFFTVVVSFLTFSLLSQPIEFSCVDTLDLDGATIVDGTYNASQIISSNNVIKPGSAVNFRAGQRIELKPGFHAQAGSSFTASIDAIPCTPATLIDGSYTRPNPIPDSLIAYYDRWGNGYSDFELQHFTIVEECNSSYFNLLFSGQFTDSEQSTICDVFSYLATTITPAVPDPEITIRVVKGVTTDPGTLAFGSPYWDAEECGIANSVIERILIGGDPSRYGREHGYILVNEDFDGEWYTGEQASRDGLYDLYTVILHEAMHVLGFASRISDKMGTPLGADQGNNAYSRFDQFLYSDSINAFLINSVVSPTECCDEHTFNSSTSDNIRPSCGNHLFFRSDGNNIAPINGNNSQVLNLLSHFNETCGGEPYVMRPGIARGEARDVLTPAELEVLRSIGYVVNSLPPPCDVIAVEDIIVQELQSPVTTFTIPVSNLTSNDVFPINGTFTYNEACGEQENLIISFDGTAFSIDATEAGTYTLCYTITGCNNEVCDQGTFKIILLNPVEESCTDCDIVCIGDFESFSSREEMQLRLAGNFGFNADAYLFSFYQAQNSPDFHRTFDLFLSNFSCDETVSIDQFGLEGEQFGAFYGTLFSDGTVDKEGMVFELSEPIQPGEEAEISFIAWTDMLCGLSSPYITVEFLASDPILGEVVYANPGISGTSVNIDISNDYPPTYRQADIVNNTSDTWRYVILSPLFQNLPPGISIFQTYAYIDDITLIKKKAIAISSPVSDFVCPGDVIPVDFELCNPHPSLSPELVLDLTLPSGVTLLNAGTFGDGISATLPEGTIAENGCYTVTAFIRIEETVTIGQPLDIQLDIAPGGCYSPSTFTKTITPVDNPLTINKNYTQIGNQFTFTIQVCNTLNQALDNVYIEDRFPPGFTVNNPGGYTISGNIASQTISIPANSCRTRFYTGTLPAGYCPDTYCATAEIEGNGCGRVRECVELNTSAIIPPDAGFTYNLNCNTLTLTFTSASTDPTASHFWNFGDGTTSTTANPSRTYAATGSYPVLHTVSNGCEEVVEEMLVVVDDCTANFTCGCVNTSFNIGDPAGGTTLFSNTGLPASLPGNTCLAIAGTLVIDSDFSVNQGTIYMQPGAEIRIPSGQMLTLDDVMVQGCPNEMWQSITVEDGGRLVMRFSNVLDAIAAVSLQDGAEAELMDNVFNRNYIGLDITGVPVLFPEGNLFTCTANLNDGRWGFAGVRVQDGTFITGSSSGVVFLNNIFQNTDYGIWADNSFIAVCDATFNNFRRVSGGTGRVDKSGTGVYARRSSALINMNTFTNSYHAIFTEECHLQLNNNDISTTNIGMLLLSPLWKFEAKENDMECSHIGIEVSHPVTTLVQDLLDNVIHLDRSASSIAPPVDQSSNGIVIAGVRTGSPVAHGHIHRNTITFASTSALVSGILLYGAENQELLENDINTSTTNQAYGLLAFSTFGTRVGDNTITGVGSPTNIGIYAGLSRSNIYCCNSISGAYVNSLFVGASNDTRIRQNDFGSANFGIRYASGTITGQQTHAGNRWNGTYANFGAQHLGNLLQAEFSQFFVGTLSPPLTPSTFSPSILFSPDINGSAASDCETDPVCSTFASLQNFITETDYSTANKEFLIGDYGDMLQFESERHLYEKLSDDEELTGKEGILDSFYVEQNHTPVAQLEEIQKELTSIMTLGASLLNQLEMDEPVITDYILDIEEVDSTFQQATTEIERNNLFSQKTSLLSSLSTLSSYRINELNGAREDIKITVGYAKQENEDLPTSNVLIVNEKTVTSSYIKNVLKGKELTTSDSIDLFNIASQCPQEGGRAVYKARGLYNSIFGSTIFDDELLCSGSSSSLVESRSDSSPMVRSSDKIVKLYPNPTSGNLTIEVVARHTNSTIKFQLLSITGKTVAEYNLMKNITEISLSELSSGLYFGKVITNGELFEVHKIIYSNE